MVATHVAWTETDRPRVYVPAERDPGPVYVGKHRPVYPRLNVEMTRLTIFIRDDPAVTDPERNCRNWKCRDTNWGGRGRLHSRGSGCPPYNRKEVQHPAIGQYEREQEMGRKNAAYYDRLRDQKAGK